MLGAIASIAQDQDWPLLVLVGVTAVLGCIAVFVLLTRAARLRAAVHDIEATKRRLEAANAELSTALAAANASNQAKAQFLATMSHELRTPLTAIAGFTEFLSSDLCGPLTQKQRGYLGDIHDAGSHLLALVNDVIDLSQIDAQRLALDEEVFDLGSTIAGAVTMISIRADKAEVAMRTAVAVGLPPVRADQRRVRQILLNLMSNALKFTPAGGTITVSAARRGAGIAILVTDNGIGMAPEHIPIALERFGQIDSRVARRHRGCGLGLPLVEQLVQLHGGTLSIDSALGRGTTVTVELPAERVILHSAAA